MKKFLLLSVSLFFLFIYSNAQLVANAGPDRIYSNCPPPVVLGGNPSASGGTSPYTYLWVPSRAGVTWLPNRDSTSATPYVRVDSTTMFTLHVTDALGDTASDVVIVRYAAVSDLQVSASIIGLAQCVGAGLILEAAATGGDSLVYFFSWNVGNGWGTFQDGWAAIDNTDSLKYIYQSPGTYNNIMAIVSDGVGCRDTAFLGPITASLLTTSTSVTGETVTGACDGSIVSTSTGGYPPYSYQWINSTATTSSISNICPGLYTLNITDVQGCTSTTVDVVGCANNTLSLSLNSSGIHCNQTTATITANLSGGTPPYSYLWNNGRVTRDIVVNQGGIYQLWVTDSVGCVKSAIDTVVNGNTEWGYYVSLNSTQSNCSSNGTATAIVHGGSPPFNYLWNTTPPQTTQTATGLPGGLYAVTVTGSNACVRTGNITIPISCANIITGRLIYDLNNNCVLDSGETPVANRNVIADGVTDYYGSTNAQGYFTLRVTSGTYVVRPVLNTACLAGCASSNTSYTYNFTTLGDDTISTANFYLVPPLFNLKVTQGWAGFRPGFTAAVGLFYDNVGTTNVNASLTFTYDADLRYISASGNPIHDSTNHTLTWLLNNIPATLNYTNANQLTVNLRTPIGTPLNTPIVNTANISGPPNECDAADNSHVVDVIVRGSYDPNDKAVSPAGDIFEEDSTLTYTIRFQNTGNDTAWFVVLKDTLSAYLEPGSVENIASSHPITKFKMEGEGILTWEFDPIYLVDSFTNEPASHGYVVFRVKKKSGLQLTTVIPNTAHIYFDYNEPVVTNTITNTITEPTYIFTVRSDENISVAAIPNPFTHSTQIVVEGINSAFDFELFDVTGKVMKKISSIHENRFDLKREDMSAGVYFYRLTSASKQRAHGRIVVE